MGGGGRRRLGLLQLRLGHVAVGGPGLQGALRPHGQDVTHAGAFRKGCSAEDDLAAGQDNGAGPSGRRLVASDRERQRRAFLLHFEAQPFGVPRDVSAAFGLLRRHACAWARRKYRPWMKAGDRLAVASWTTSAREDARKLPVVNARSWPLCKSCHNGHYEKTSVMTSSGLS